MTTRTLVIQIMLRPLSLALLLAVASPLAAQRPDSTAKPDSAAKADSAARGISPLLAPRAGVTLAGSDTLPRRRRAVEYSEWYGRRLTIHRWASYAVIPLFVAQYSLGEKLMEQRKGERADDGGDTRDLHSIAAGGVAGLFGVNTLTGLWNLWDARHDPDGRARRTTHVVTMLAADAGFVATGILAGEAEDGGGNAQAHKNVAIASMGVATLGTVAMWLWKD